MVDAATVLSTHLTEVLKTNMSDLLSYGEVQKLLKELPKEQSELVKDIVPAQITVSGIQRVLQLLLAERISIRDLSDHPGRHRRRARLLAQPGRPWSSMCAPASPARSARRTPRHNGYLPLIALSAKWEQAFAESIVGQGEDKQPRDAALEAVRVHHLGARALRAGRARGRSAGAGHLGRRSGRSSARSSSASAPRPRVLSQAEIHPRARLKTVGSI